MAQASSSSAYQCIDFYIVTTVQSGSFFCRFSLILIDSETTEGPRLIDHKYCNYVIGLTKFGTCEGFLI